MKDEDIRQAFGANVGEPDQRVDMLFNVERTIQKRRRVTRVMTVGVAAFAAAALVGGTAFALPHFRPGSDATQPSDAVSAPPRTTDSPTPSNQTESTTGPVSPCTSSQLDVKWVALWPAAGTETSWITVTNSGSATCSLPETTPGQLAGVAGDGTHTDIQADSVSAKTFDLSPVTQLQPGEPAGFTVTVGDPSLCASGNGLGSYSQLQFSLGTGAALLVAFSGPVKLDLACGQPQVSALGQQQTTGPSKPSSDSGLSASNTIPSTVSAGGTVEYTVTLTNSTDFEVQLDPCPSYSQFLADLGTSPRSVTTTGTLDCSEGATVPAHGQLTFKLSVQAPQQPGTAKFGWQIDDSDPLIQTGAGVQVQ
jgi:hypothetical protein